MEVRGFCRPCRQWQDCPTRIDGHEATARCPVCHTAPTMIDTHGSTALRGGRRQAEGYCTTRHTWFACDTWFEIDQPLPTRCGAAPSRLHYETAHGWRTLPPDSHSAD